MSAQYYDTWGSTEKLIGIVDSHLRADGFDPNIAHRFKIMKTRAGDFMIVLEALAAMSVQSDKGEG